MKEGEKERGLPVLGTFVFFPPHILIHFFNQTCVSMVSQLCLSLGGACWKKLSDLMFKRRQ